MSMSTPISTPRFAALPSQTHDKAVDNFSTIQDQLAKELAYPDTKDLETTQWLANATAATGVRLNAQA